MLICVATIFSIISLSISLYSLMYIRKIKDEIKKCSEISDEEFHLGFEEP